MPGNYQKFGSHQPPPRPINLLLHSQLHRQMVLMDAWEFRMSNARSSGRSWCRWTWITIRIKVYIGFGYRMIARFIFKYELHIVPKFPMRWLPALPLNFQLVIVERYFHNTPFCFALVCVVAFTELFVDVSPCLITFVDIFVNSAGVVLNARIFFDCMDQWSDIIYRPLVFHFKLSSPFRLIYSIFNWITGSLYNSCWFCWRLPTQGIWDLVICCVRLIFYRYGIGVLITFMPLGSLDAIMKR